MRILLTNDDGIQTEGILALEAWAETLGEVTVVAPKTEQSGKSHSIELHKSFEVIEIEPNHFSLDSSPADCVRFAFSGLGKSFDLVLSGINKGFNVGTDIVYSGTDGAVFEADCYDCPGLAISTDPSSFHSARANLDLVWSFIQSHGLLKLNPIYNINIPLNPKSIRITSQGSPYYKDRFICTQDNMFMADGYSVFKGTCDLTKDIDATLNGHISITPIHIDRTNNRVYEDIKALWQEV